MTERRWIYAFDDGLPEGTDERELLGGKAAGLRRLRAFGADVPPGFTITTEACRAFLAADGCWPPGLEEELAVALAELASTAQRLFGTSARPLLLAVRSGAARSMPGMLATVLHCGATRPAINSPDYAARMTTYARFAESLARAAGALVPAATVTDDVTASCQQWIEAYECHRGQPFPQTAEEALRAAIECVFLSWQGRAARELRRVLGMADDAGTAVTIQQLVEPTYSGVMLTRDPSDRERRTLLVEAVRGYGELLVRGAVTPEQYLLHFSGDADPAEASFWQPTPVASQSVERLLTPGHLRRLAETALRLEQAFGEPLDLEWALVDERLVLLQARGLEAVHEADTMRLVEVERHRLQQQAAAGTRHWVRHSLAETLPFPTPLSFSLMQRLMGPRGAYVRMYAALGYRWPASLGTEGFLRQVFGRIYCDPDRLAIWLASGLPLRYDIAALSEQPEQLDFGPQAIDLAAADPLLLLRLPLIAWRQMRIRHRTRTLAKRVKRIFEEQAAKHFQEYLRAERSLDLASCSLPELLERFESRSHQMLEHWPALLWLPGLFGGMAYAELARKCEQLLGADQGAEWLQRLCGSILPPSTREGPSAQPHDLEGNLELLLESHGHRGPGEMELMQPRWRELPGEFARWVERTQTSIGEADQHARASETEDELALFAAFARCLREQGASSLAPRMQALAALVRELLPYRETGRHYFLMGYELLRDVARELGRRAHLDEGIFFLNAEELATLENDAAALRAVAQARRAEWLVLQRIPIPAVITAAMIDKLGEQPSSSGIAGDEMPATVLSRGRARGRVQLVEGFEFESHAPGAVVVCAALEPALAPLLMRAAALVVEEGGMLSHGALVARQFGIPAVVCAGARAWLRPNDLVEVDAERGAVIRAPRGVVSP